MKYFKILEISYSDNLNITYCKELKELEEHKNFKTDLDKELAKLEKPEA